MQKTYPHIGNVEIVVNKRLKRINLKVQKTGEVQLIIPHVKHLSAAEKFLLQRTDWIVKTKQAVEQKLQKKLLLANTEKITPQHNLRFVDIESTKPLRAKISETEIIIFISPNIDRSSKQVQDFVRKVREEALVNMARICIPQRLAQLAAEQKFRYAQCKISRAKTRWGSCSHANTISISCYSMILPPHLIDFLLLHELTHTIHKNHAREFHAHLQRCLPKPEKDYEREIRQYSILN
ncbi:MAG: M48 family metallopeptidase [Bacteroidales bacterium]|jgi:predicted metal-dependent hydrolase|nr:M48 family metallopeptidase [Bacteroidales bacterium]